MNHSVTYLHLNLHGGGGGGPAKWKPHASLQDRKKPKNYCIYQDTININTVISLPGV